MATGVALPPSAAKVFFWWWITDQQWRLYVGGSTGSSGTAVMPICVHLCGLSRASTRPYFSDVTQSVVERCLLTEDAAPPDLLVRTSGETRLSDFMLWQVRQHLSLPRLSPFTSPAVSPTSFASRAISSRRHAKTCMIET